MYSYELGRLLAEYENASSKEDVIIKMKLDNILSIYKNCDKDEAVFTNEIINEFCRLITILKEQQKRHIELNLCGQENLQSFIKAEQQSITTYLSEEVQYQNDEELMNAFYNHFKEKMVEVTLKDYMSRIYTFTNRYLWGIPDIRELWAKESQRLDPIMFTYKYLELILARFDTKDNGVSNKQKVNIRSALRKLNDFKRHQQFRK